MGSGCCKSTGGVSGGVSGSTVAFVAASPVDTGLRFMVVACKEITECITRVEGTKSANDTM